MYLIKSFTLEYLIVIEENVSGRDLIFYTHFLRKNSEL